MNFRGLQPDTLVDNDQPYRFTLGGREFVVIAAAGAEGADNVVLWLPAERALLSGDFFGPQFPQFPNLFTMRGEKARKAVEYATSIDALLQLQPEVLLPSHLDTVQGTEIIKAGMIKIRDAVQWVHDQTVAGMNAGQSLATLMAQVTLPENLALSESHGKVSWAVKTIWEYYATWFHFDRTSELYATPFSSGATQLGTRRQSGNCAGAGRQSHCCPRLRGRVVAPRGVVGNCWRDPSAHETLASCAVGPPRTWNPHHRQ